MIGYTRSSPFPRIRRKLFKWRVDFEIHDRLFTHHREEKDFGYPFRTTEQMKRQTEELNVHELLDTIERHIQGMPVAYGESFRYILHRELQERLSMFEALARRRVQPTSIDPRFVAIHA